MSQIENSRRQFLIVSAAAAAASLLPRVAVAQELPHLGEAEATAAALGYKEDSNKVDAAKYPNHKPTQNCANCKLVQGKDGDAYRPCGIFPGKSVAAQGWCAAYAAKA